MKFKNFINEKKSALNLAKESIQEVEDEIYQLFGKFLMAYQNNDIDFQNLTISQVAILNATPLGLRIPLEEEQSFKVTKVTESKIYIMYYRNSKKQKGLSEITLKSKGIKTHYWSEFPELNLSIEGINVERAVFNLSKNTSISALLEDEAATKKLLKPLVKKIKSQLKDFLSNCTEDFECENLNTLHKERQAV